MATTTITITSATNPTYGGHIVFDGDSTYTREVLSARNPEVHFDGASETQRVFAFFDLSTDPTSGGSITKVELLATVNSVSGTHAVDVLGGPSYASGGPGPGVDPTALSDDQLFSGIQGGGDFNIYATPTPSAGAFVLDAGVNGINDVQTGITSQTGLFWGMRLSNEVAAGSVVFDAAVGFGLRLTYTPGGDGLGPKRILLLGVG